MSSSRYERPARYNKKFNRLSVVSSTTDGHRSSYIDLLSELFPSERKSVLQACFTRGPVVFLMMEEAFFLYFFIAVLRGVLCRRTISFLFRPIPAGTGRSLRLRIKRLFLRVLMKLEMVSVLTLLPLELIEGSKNIAKQYIYDLQLWDLSCKRALPPRLANHGNCSMHEISRQIKLKAKDRIVVVSLGRQDHHKGFDDFAGMYISSEIIRDRYLFVFAGLVSPHSELELLAHGFVSCGGLGINRYISDEEIIDIYDSADLIWCSYSSDYDQASGVFGRAVQLGVMPIVRKDSTIHKFCLSENIRHLIPAQVESMEEKIGARCPNEDLIRRMRNYSCRKISKLSQVELNFGY